MRFYFFLILFAISGCSDDDPNQKVLPPSNLQVDVDASMSHTGKISVTATADDANFYRFKFDEASDFIRDDDGDVEFQYASSGTYEILVRAHTTMEVFIEEKLNVEIDIDEVIPEREGYSTPESYEGYTLVWQDEFDGNQLDASSWTYEIGTGSNGWGNNELQYYRAENTSVEDGLLTIEARKENFGDRQYTSSRIITKDKREFMYGRIDIRAILPKGQGIWPALWMLGANFPEVGWPASGELDIMEMIGGSGRENTVHGTLHWSNNGDYASYGGDYTLSAGIFSDKFHVFTIIWNESSIKWYVDDQHFHTIDISPAELSEFRQEFFFIFNVAVGGNWPGDPDSATTFPQQMMVDYIRVFQMQ